MDYLQATIAMPATELIAIIILNSLLFVVSDITSPLKYHRVYAMLGCALCTWQSFYIFIYFFFISITVSLVHRLSKETHQKNCKTAPICMWSVTCGFSGICVFQFRKYGRYLRFCFDFYFRNNFVPLRIYLLFSDAKVHFRMSHSYILPWMHRSFSRWCRDFGKMHTLPSLPLRRLWQTIASVL